MSVFNSLVRFICFLFIVLDFGNTNAQSPWITFTPTGQPFEVKSPGEMKNGEKNILTDMGYIRPVTWLYQGLDADPNYLYMVSYIDYPQGTFHRDSTNLMQELLNVSLETQLKDLAGTLVYKSEAPYRNHPGIIYRAAYNTNKAVVKGRIILVNERLYFLQVYTLSEKSLNHDMDKFLESFKIK